MALIDDMAKRPDKNLIIGLDIGTSKVSALVGEVGARRFASK